MTTRAASPTADLGSFIRAGRHRAGLSLASAADAAGICKSHLSHIEAGEKTPSPDVLERIGVAVGMDPRTARVWARPVYELVADLEDQPEQVLRRVVAALYPRERRH